MSEKVIVAWSGGKDSALALHEILESGRYKVQELLTTVTRDYDRISIHGVRSVLLEQQARVLGFPLEKTFISKGDSEEEY
jgi:diphthamide synthase (EF-2-diphthine--ammonia ligase)